MKLNIVNPLPHDISVTVDSPAAVSDVVNTWLYQLHFDTNRQILVDDIGTVAIDSNRAGTHYGLVYSVKGLPHHLTVSVPLLQYMPAVGRMN